MSQRLFGVTRLAALGKEIAQLVEADGDIARGLRRVRVPLQEPFADFEAACVVSQRLVGVSGLTAPEEEIAEPVAADGDIARGLRRVRVALQEPFADFQAARVASQRLFGVARLTAPGEEIAQLVEADGDVARGLRRVRVPLQSPSLISRPRV